MKHLTKEQRYQIKAYLNCGKSKDFIAKSLSVDKTTIYREINRNSKKQGSYNPDFAHELYSERKEPFPYIFTNLVSTGNSNPDKPYS